MENIGGDDQCKTSDETYVKKDTRIPTIDGDLSDTDRNMNRSETKKPKRVLHFSDGVIEEFSSEDEKDDSVPATTSQTTESKVIADPRTLTWLPWLYWRAWTAGGTVVAVMDTIGEKLAWWLGITSPKYYYEIQEAIRMKEEEEQREKDEEAEMSGWRKSPPVGGSNQTRVKQPSYHTNEVATSVLHEGK